MAEVKPIPEGFHTITTHITVDDTAAAIDFYQNLGATPLDEWTQYRMTGEPLERLGRAFGPGVESGP